MWGQLPRASFWFSCYVTLLRGTGQIHGRLSHCHLVAEYIVLLNQCSCWPPKCSRHFHKFTTFTIAMVTISHTFWYRIVLKIIKISGHLSKKSNNGLWPGGNKYTLLNGCWPISTTLFLLTSNHWLQGKITIFSATRWTVTDNLTVIVYLKHAITKKTKGYPRQL